ncbi:hypothetical protein SE17_33985 [Kouleothrix aurantiaca]|uniref:Uncharacterized protein n=1 Tax=Kouleothrix aurantiaca TaxID=186479 RepID=A0A0P9F9Q6_9CHLR|nr:hypothetical protein SE17_33985 [Kouleothrix aurantiaca]
MNIAQSHTTQRPAFRWRLAQPLALALSGALGAISGVAFGRGSLGFAWMMFLFGFVWVLIISVALGMWLAVRARLARADWRAGLHIGLASAFPPATVYMAVVALLTAHIPLTNVVFPNGGHALSRPDIALHFPILYCCSLIVSLLSGPLFAA